MSNRTFHIYNRYVIDEQSLDEEEVKETYHSSSCVVAGSETEKLFLEDEDCVREEMVCEFQAVSDSEAMQKFRDFLMAGLHLPEHHSEENG